MSKERLEEHTHLPIKTSEYKELKEQAERVQELEKEFERYDITNHKIGMTINNPNMSDDEKWNEVNRLLSEAWEIDCIHCNGKGFNGLDYCPQCVRGELLKENFVLEQQNKRYREAIMQLQGHLFNKWDSNLNSKAQWDIHEFAQGILESESE